ncbi:DUF6510 family protein [Micromonospora palythoicola]|uniref:DUF6510 family protein n=1 Tax=Micromonospora palythoicola TaxID=3120507 RepID=UPI002FCDFA01
MTALPYVDGNMLDGPLGEVFAVDLSSATARCAHCGTPGPVAGLRVYSQAPGLVGRCPTCVEVMLRLVRAPDRAWLDLRGATFLQFPLPPERTR